MALIEYHQGSTLLHKLDPRVKMILLLLFTMLVFAVKSFLILSVLFLAVIILWKWASLPLGRLKNNLSYILGLILFLIVVQSLFIPGKINLVKPLIPESSPVLPGRGYISLKGIMTGILLGFRLFVLMLLMPTFIMTTTINEMVQGMVRLGFPYRIAYLLTTSVNMIPALQNETRTIMEAQKMRGFTVFEEGRFRDKMRAYPALAVPLVIGAMRKAQSMGVAMDARAFGAGKYRTYRTTLRMKKRDWLCFILLLLLAAFLFAAALILEKEIHLWNNL